MSDLVGNPEDRFSRVAAHAILVSSTKIRNVFHELHRKKTIYLPFNNNDDNYNNRNWKYKLF